MVGTKEVRTVMAHGLDSHGTWIQSITRFLYVLLLKTDFPSLLFIFAAEEFFYEKTNG